MIGLRPRLLKDQWQTHGRLGHVALRVLLDHSWPVGNRRPRPLSQDLRWAVACILNNVPLAQPCLFSRTVRTHFYLLLTVLLRNPVLVLCDASGTALEFFGFVIPPKIVTACAWTGTERPVQAEFLAVLVSVHVRGHG